MFTINTYMNNILQITNSLVLHLPFVGIQTNSNLLNQYQDDTAYNESNKEEWKYYLNLSGRYHKTDRDILIRPLHTDDKMKLTTSLLETYPNMREELLKFGDYYNEVVNLYPAQESLIKGIISPVDINTAIDSEIGTILNYNKNKLAVYEIDMLKELELYIKEFLGKWFNPLYSITDEYYISYKLSILYSGIVLKIYNIRLDNIKTDKVHDYFLYEFFKSHKYLHEDTSVLTREVKLWLYRNIPYLDTHIGKNSTLQAVIDNVYEKMHVGVGELKLVENVYVDDLIISDVNKPVAIDRSVVITANALNESYSKRDGVKIPVENILERELKDTIVDEKELSHYVEYYKEDLIKSVGYKQAKSKILELDILEDIKLTPYDMLPTILDTWVYTAFNNKFSNVETFIDPNNNKEYKLSPKQGIYLLFKLLQDMNGYKDLVIDEYKYYSLCRDTFDIIPDTYLSHLEIDSLITKLSSVYPEQPTFISSAKDFKTYLDKITDFNSYIWSESSNIQNMVVSADIENLRNDLLITGTVSMNINKFTIDDILINENIDFIKNSGYDYLISIYTLLKTFTGFDLGDKEKLESKISKYINILNKLTSYTIQVLPSTDDKAKQYIAYSTLSTNKDITVVDLNEGKFKCLEDFDGIHRVEVYEDLNSEVNESLSNISINPDAKIDTCRPLKRPILHGYNSNVPDMSGIILRVTVSKTKCINKYKPKMLDVVTYPNTIEEITFNSIEVKKKEYATLTGKIEYNNSYETGIALRVTK